MFGAHCLNEPMRIRSLRPFRYFLLVFEISSSASTSNNNDSRRVKLRIPMIIRLLEFKRLPDTAAADVKRPPIAIPMDIPIGSWNKASYLPSRTSTNKTSGF